MVLQVEAQQIVTQEAIQDFRPPGADAEDFIVGPGNVPELRHHQIGLRFFEHPGQQGKMVVLDEDDGAPGIGHLGKDHLGKLAVDGLVGLPLAGVKARPGISRVA